MRKILVLTGKRGGYGAMKPMLEALKNDFSIDLQLVVTDQHLNPSFGMTINEIEKDFSVAAKVDMNQQGSELKDRSNALGVCVIGLTDTFEKLKPDLCVLYGDRGEVLSAALVATTMRVPIVHLQGGDLSGSVDDQMRHAITKLAHLHLVSNKLSAERIIKMGEDPSRVHVIGDNHIDSIIKGNYAKPEVIAKRLNLDLKRPVFIVLQHSETTEPQNSYQQMLETLSAVSDFNEQTIVIYPCSDSGYQGVINAIEKFTHLKNFSIKKNLDAEIFWGLLSVASVMIGNSSAGIVETPCFGLPTVNIGRRQIGRLCSDNVLHVPHSRNEISLAIRKCLSDTIFIKQSNDCLNPYGDGTAWEKAVELIKSISLSSDFFIKKMTY
jgi:GDP/UDP-N,N'-diacetylbacillosamine 2-epimerase (hydrolysing)